MSFLMLGCGFASDSNEKIREQVTCYVDINVNLSANAPSLDTNEFNPERSTFNRSVSFTFFDIFAQAYLLSAYFVKTDQQANAWDVYFFYDDLPIDIVAGTEGGNQQLKSQLQFDEDGQLNMTIPEVILSENIIVNDDNYFHSLKFRFAKNLTTQYDAAFSSVLLGNTCFLEI